MHVTEHKESSLSREAEGEAFAEGLSDEVRDESRDSARKDSSWEEAREVQRAERLAEVVEPWPRLKALPEARWHIKSSGIVGGTGAVVDRQRGGRW
eukprot:scaffold191914_cov32-Tisochrysis_lutea.AAC.2